MLLCPITFVLLQKLLYHLSKNWVAKPNAFHQWFNRNRDQFFCDLKKVWTQKHRLTQRLAARVLRQRPLLSFLIIASLWKCGESEKSIINLYGNVWRSHLYFYFWSVFKERTIKKNDPLSKKEEQCKKEKTFRVFFLFNGALSFRFKFLLLDGFNL